MKRILLINPNTVQPPVAPLGLDYIASSLISYGCEVRVYDFNCETESLSDVISDFEPEVVGITVRNVDDSCFNTQEFFLPRVRELVGFIKEKGIRVILGGVGFSLFPYECLSYTGADAGVSGDGESAFGEMICDGVISGVREVPFSDFRIFCPSRGFIDNRFYYERGGMVGIEATRGCDRGCIYCADPLAKGRTVRFRNVKFVVDELKFLVDEGIFHFHFCDSEFNLSLHYAKELCREIVDRGLGDKIKWYAYAVPDVMDNELASLMKRAGCEGINFGVDHTDDSILSFLGKGFRFSDVKRTVEIMKREGIKVMIDLLLGCPYETEESVKKVIRDIKELNPYRAGTSYGIRVYPRTPFYKWLVKRGFDVPQTLLKPFFYISDKVKDTIEDVIMEETKDDERFFTNFRDAGAKNYNYNANEVLVEAIKSGERGAFWDILARYQMRDRKSFV